MTKFVSEKIKMRSGARLAAVQASYMIEFGQLNIDEAVKDFLDGSVGRYVIEETGFSGNEELVEINQIDKQYFENLVRGVQKNKEAVEKSIASFLNEKWSFEAMNGTLRALLLCAAYELANTTDVDAKVLIQEYVDLAYAFFTKNEPKMVNALLDQIAHSIRGTNDKA